MTRWYRAYEGTVTDPKLGEVALVAGCSRSVAIAAWHCILESAATVNDGGRFDATPRRIAVILGEKPQLIETILAEMAAIGMVANETVTAWSRRQYESDTSTERSRKHRERLKNANATTRNGDATLRQQHATPPETETETETETEEEGKKSPAIAVSVADATPECPHAEIIELYHRHCIALPRVREWTEPRRKLLRQRWRENPERQRIEWWAELFCAVARSPFLSGANDRNWTPDLEWILRPSNFVKVIEGRYDVAPIQRFSKTTQANIRAAEAFVNAN